MIANSIVLPHNRGGDTAEIDGNSPPDYAAAFATGARFMYLKRCQHVYPDKFFARDADRARKAGLVVGSYHFPGWGPSAVSAKAQVAAFKKSGGDVIPSVDLPPMIDVESGSGAIWLKVPHAFIIEQVRQFVLELEDQVQVTPGFYTSFMQWYDIGLPSAPWMARCPLWIKTAYRVGAGQPVDTVEPPTPHFGADNRDVYHQRDYYRCPDPWKGSGWLVQQFQGDSRGFPGHDKTVDVNKFHTVYPGDHDPLVATYQQRLGLPATGAYDDATQAAVAAEQVAGNLGADKIIGPRTAARILWMPAPIAA